jgi:hypothetical protein
MHRRSLRELLGEDDVGAVRLVEGEEEEEEEESWVLRRQSSPAQGLLDGGRRVAAESKENNKKAPNKAGRPSSRSAMMAKRQAKELQVSNATGSQSG